MRRVHYCYALLVWAACACIDIASAAVVYVDKDNVSGIEDGTSWATAFTTLQPAMDAAGDNGTVWIAEGLYDEARSGHEYGGLIIKDALHVFGGFTGTETSVDQRDLAHHETIVDGSKAFNGQAAPTVVWTYDAIELDGLIVQGGRAQGRESHLHDINSCGGLAAFAPHDAQGNPIPNVEISIRNCTFRDNRAYLSCAPLGIFPEEDIHCVIQNCLFENNAITYSFASNEPLIELNPFEPPGSYNDLSYCPYPSGGSRYLVDSCIFRRNTGNFDSYVHVAGEDVVFANCLFDTLSGERHELQLGSHAYTDTLTVRNCEFQLGGSAQIGANYALGTLSFEKSFVGKDKGYFSGFYLGSIGALTVSGCVMDNGIYCECYSPYVQDSQFGNCAIDSCTFANYASLQVPSGIGLYTVSNCVFTSQLLYTQGCPPIIHHSLLPAPAAGEGNITGDPRFVDVTSRDYRLLPDSPCVDTGDPNAAATRDIAGHWRPQGAGMDMGAYEYEEADSDGDGIFDVTEGAGDFDHDGISNDLDSDSDGDGIDDVIEGVGDPDHDGAMNFLDLDSDDDGIEDALERALGLDPLDAADIEADADNDGLTNRDEAILYHTDPLRADSDKDLMRDGWEVAHHLNSLENDAANDPDGDQLPNIYEHTLNSDPQNTNDPPTEMYVTEGGSDNAPGNEAAPWVTIAHAMTAAQLYTASNLYTHPMTIHLGAGVFNEHVEMAPQTTLSGAGQDATVIRHFDAAETEHIVVNAAQHCAVQDLVITLPAIYPAVEVLMRIEDVAANVTRVTFNGKFNQNATGILISGVNSSASQIRDCMFKNLNDAIWDVESGVNIANNTFDAILKDAIFINPPQGDFKTEIVPLLGDSAHAESTGGNVFRGVDGRLVRNLGNANVIAENNDWGFYTPAEIATKMYGAVDFVPFLKQTEGETEGEGDPEGTPDKPKFLASLGCGNVPATGGCLGDLAVALGMAATVMVSRRKQSIRN